MYLELTKEKKDQIPVLIASAQQQLFDGFMAYDKLDTMPLPTLVAFVQRFAEVVGKYDRRIGAYVTANIEEPLQLQLHTRWLKDFNTRFIDIPTPSVSAA